jgi:hypothetical protein
VIADDGVFCSTAEFPASSKGHRELLVWLRSHGDLVAVGVEGTGSYGAVVTRHLLHAGVKVLEVNRPKPPSSTFSGQV